MAGIKRSSKEPAPELWTCTMCGETKPFTREFFKPAAQRAWGLHKECRSCLNRRELDRRRTNPKARESIKKWVERNIEKVRESARRTAKRRRDKHRAYIAEWRRKNPHKAREYYKRTAQGKSLQQKAWRSANKDRLRVYTNNYRARKRFAGGQHASSDILRIGAAQRWRCAACAARIKFAYHVDHISPISKGGTNDPGNLQLLCATCNRRKSDKEPERFMRELGFLL